MRTTPLPESALLAALASLAACPAFALEAAPAGTDANDPLLKAGCLDVTKAPYRADPTGAADATKAIQQAVNDARDHQYVCFFPSGRYLISDTIDCQMPARKLSAPRGKGKERVAYDIVRDHPCILVGSAKGPRPTLVLAPGARGFDDPAKPKPAVRIWAQTRNSAPGKQEPVWGKEQANISFNQMFRGIDIDVRGHAGAIGIRHTGSQGSTLEEVTIHAEGAYAGMRNCAGQGGGTYAITVIGGRYGMYATQECRFPMLAGCDFQGQTHAAVYYGGQAIPLLLVGCRIQTKGGVAVDMTEAKAGLGLIDCAISIAGRSGAAATIVADAGPGAAQLENVFVSGAERVAPQAAKLPGAKGWTAIARYASSPAAATQYVNGKLTAGEIAEMKAADAPPAFDALRAKHLWSATPSFEDADAVNARTLGAVGDGVADDTAALQKAIDTHPKVFLPRGTYRLTKPLVLGAKTTLFGVARVYSKLLATDGFGEKNQPLVTTVDNAQAETQLAFLSLAQYETDPNVNLLTWRAGRNSIARGVYYELEQAPQSATPRKVREHATCHVTGNGGGRWFAVNAVEGKFAPTTGHPGYRRLLVDGTSEPMAYYALNIERVVANPQAEIRNASNVRIYYFKTEAGSSGANSRNTPLLIANSRNVAVYCGSGVVEVEDGRPMIDIVDSAPVAIWLFKSFRSGEFLTLREKRGSNAIEIPSEKMVSSFWRDGQ